MKINYPLLIMFLIFQALEFLFYGGLAALVSFFFPVVNAFYLFVILATLDVVSVLVFFPERVEEFAKLVFPEDEP